MFAALLDCAMIVQLHLRHEQRKFEMDNKVGGARHGLQTMGVPPTSLSAGAERSAAHDLHIPFVTSTMLIAVVFRKFYKCFQLSVSKHH